MSWPAVYHGLPLAALPAKDQADGSFASSRQISIANLVLALAANNAPPGLSLSSRLIVGREPKAAFRCARANNGELFVPRETVLTHRERFAVDHNSVVRESADDPAAGSILRREGKLPQPGARSGSQLTRAVFHQSWACLSSPGTSVPVALPGQQPQLRRWSVTDAARDHSRNRRLGVHIPAA
jgi:hypothetical protein